MTPDDDVDRHLRALLSSYGTLEREQARMDAVIEERTAEAVRNRERVDKQLGDLDEAKAEAKDLAAVVDRLDKLDGRLGGIQKLLVGLLASITLASIGFGFAALQIAGSHP
ncbi:MAG TPA: hypothetical protein VFG87_15175 [Amycolatopsis sp.]|jgi:hypothetical protein|nr:hypothetical protein [Amycolatopsis sp.]